MIRITGGQWRGRQIKTPNLENSNTRPSQAKLRQALFNSIQFQISDARVVDLFAGPGTLGLEALSRGAAHVTFVENARACTSALADNLTLFKAVERARVLGSGVESWLKSPGGPYDLVLADPPYADGWELRLIETVRWDQVLQSRGLFLLEWGAQKSQVQALPDRTPFLVKIREKNYGDSVLTTYQRASAQGEPQGSEHDSDTA